jgi:type VI secretion system secreted protein VgrG
MARDYVRAELQGAFDATRVQIHKLSGAEVISQLFHFDVEIAVIEPADLVPEALCGSEVDIVFEHKGLEHTFVRRVHAMVVAMDDLLDTEPEFRTYRLRLAPRAHRLTLVETQEVFLNLSVPEIITRKLDLVGLSGADVELRLTGTYAPRELTVQYKETDYAFICRLCEHLGISFFFELVGGKDVMVFTDHADGFAKIERAEPVVFRARGETSDVFQLESTQQLMPSAWVLQDYNYRTPQLDLTVSHEAAAGFAGGVVEYGAHHRTPEEGKTLAAVRAQEREARCRYLSGKSDLPEFHGGATFKLEEHPRLDGAQLLLVEVHHDLTQVTVGHGSDEEPQPYVNTFRAVSAKTMYRPPRITPRPKMHGVATALIEPNATGEIGKVARIDEQGRYTVKFYFDPSPIGSKPRSSQQVRMIQQHSGPDYGTHMPLKAGIEVLIIFVDGDPDRPLIVGSVHNPVTPSPVVEKSELFHRIKTAAGVLIEMKDDFF